MIYTKRTYYPTFLKQLTLIIAFVFIAIGTTFSQIVENFNIAGNGSWVVPAGVSSVTVEVWGAGGGSSGANSAGNGSGSGGGGGGYARSVISVTPGSTFNYIIGQGGGGGFSTGGGLNGVSTEFGGIVFGEGGQGGMWNGPGGMGGGSSGNVTYFGGDGAMGGSTSYGGGGGSSAGSNSMGSNAFNNVGGFAPFEGGNGGDGAPNLGMPGASGINPGGGGGAPSRGGGSVPGTNGADGQMRLTYSPSNNNFNIVQSIKSDSLCISFYYTNSGSDFDILGSSNLRVQIDTALLDKNSATITYRGNYDAANSTGYQAMTLSAINSTFLSLNIFNNNTTGFVPSLVPYTEHVATVCFK